MSKWRIKLALDPGKSRIYRDDELLEDVVSIVVTGSVDETPGVFVEFFADDVEIEAEDEQ